MADLTQVTVPDIGDFTDVPVIAASDYVRALPDQIRPWVEAPYTVLGTDGFGRSDTRQALRRFFEVDAECTVIAVLYALSQRGAIAPAAVAQAIKDLGIDPEKIYPQIV